MSGSNRRGDPGLYFLVLGACLYPRFWARFSCRGGCGYVVNDYVCECNCTYSNAAWIKYWE